MEIVRKSTLKSPKSYGVRKTCDVYGHVSVEFYKEPMTVMRLRCPLLYFPLLTTYAYVYTCTILFLVGTYAKISISPTKDMRKISSRYFIGYLRWIFKKTK